MLAHRTSPPPPRLAVISVVVDHSLTCCLHPAPLLLSVPVTTPQFTRKVSFHVPSRHLRSDCGPQFRTCSVKHCSHSWAFIISCLLIFRYKPIARWSTLTQPWGGKNNHSNWTPRSKENVDTVVRKAVMGRTEYIIARPKCKLKMWACWLKKKKKCIKNFKVITVEH